MMSQAPTLTHKDYEEYGRILDRVGRELDKLDELRVKDLDMPEMKFVADALHLAVYYKQNPDVVSAFRKMWFEFVDNGVLGSKVGTGEVEE